MLAIVDYNAGNTYNVQKAFAHLGVDTVLTADSDTIRNANGIILPGVGAFKTAMKALQERNLVTTLQEAARDGRPLLGICLGMQLLFESSDEYGYCEGLGLIPGTVTALPPTPGLMIPHMGWNENSYVKVTPATDSQPDFRQLDTQYTYFVHSYYAVTEPNYITAIADYGVAVPSVVQRDNVCGMQFHPEKSAAVGIGLLREFCRSVGELTLNGGTNKGATRRITKETVKGGAAQ